ncbi:MAG: ATP-binding protein [Gemmatimonadota bacterium]
MPHSVGSARRPGRITVFLLVVAFVGVAGFLARIGDFTNRTELFSLFLLAVTLGAWFGGLEAGLLATALSYLVLELWFMPRGTPWIPDTLSSAFRLSGSLAVAIVISLLAEALHRSRATAEMRARQLAEVVNRVSDAFVAIDRDWKYTYVSEKAADLLGVPVSELLGRVVWEVYPKTVGNESYEVLHRALREQRPLRFECFFPRFESWYDNQVYPSAAGLTILFTDVSERKRAEQALQESEHRLHLAQQIARVGTFDWNLETGETRWTPELEALYGLPAGGFAGSQEAFHRLVHPDDLAELLRGIEVAMSTGEFNGEFRVVWPDGTIRWLASRCRILTNGAGRPGRLIGANIDITERRLAEESLRAANVTLEYEVADRTIALELRDEELDRSTAELERYAYVASHDLQEPLRMVTNYTELLARRYRGRLDEDADVFIDFVLDGTRRMHSLITDLLGYSRAHLRPLEATRVELDTVFLQVTGALQETIGESGAVITVQQELPTLIADRGQMYRLFFNLLSNALKFRRPGESPRVQITAELHDGEWEFSVADNGIGIPEAYRAKVFSIFQRLNARDQYPGNGAGLATCKRVVERHGGMIWVEDRPGGGCIFRFRLPPILDASALAAGSRGSGRIVQRI